MERRTLGATTRIVMMNTRHRPRGQDWIAVMSAGAILGALLLGIGARAGMRIIAVVEGQPPLFTLERYTPICMWVALIVVTFAGIICGAALRQRQAARTNAVVTV